MSGVAFKEIDIKISPRPAGGGGQILLPSRTSSRAKKTEADLDYLILLTLSVPYSV